MSNYSRKLIFVLSFIGGFSSASSAQWTKIGSFPYPFNSAYFWDANTGIIGSGHTCTSNPITIWRTSDGGATWVQSTTPADYQGSVSQIFMVNKDTGWASILPWGSIGNSRLWRTTDGGGTWLEFGARGTGDGVYQTSHALIVTDLDPSVMGGISTDGGQTFNNTFQGRTTGIDFTDSLHGIITVFREGPWLSTSDGGVTWTPLNMQEEAWSIYAVKGTNTYYTCGESYNNFSTTICKKTTDQGKTWTTRSVLGFQTSGHVAAVGDELYIQTVNESPHQSGVLRSTDGGLTWTDLGGPRNWFDSRFYVFGCGDQRVIYAFDYEGGIFKYVTGIGDTNVMQFRLRATQHAVEGDCVTNVKVESNQAIAAGMLTQISFDVLYDTDLLTELSFTPAAGVTAVETPISGGRHYVVHPGTVQLDSGVAFLTMYYRTAASNHDTTSLVMQNLQVVTTTDQSAPCAPLVAAIGDSISLRGCAVSMLTQFMATGSYQISDVSPVPVLRGGEVEFSVQAPASTAIRWQILDLLGNSTQSQTGFLADRSLRQKISTVGLAPGTYFLRVQTGDGRTIGTKRFVIE